MARTKANATQNPDKQKQKQKCNAKPKSKPKTKRKTKSSQQNSKLYGEHEDDVHEALLCLLQTEKLSKEKLLKMAKYGGVETRVGRILEQVRGVDISPNGASHDDDDEADINHAHCTAVSPTTSKPALDFYDPSILASPSTSDCRDDGDNRHNKLLFDEIIDLARGGAGGHYTNTLTATRPRTQRKPTSPSKSTASSFNTQSKKRKRNCVDFSSLDALPVSPHKAQTHSVTCAATTTTKKKRRLDHKTTVKCRYSSLHQFVAKSNKKKKSNSNSKKLKNDNNNNGRMDNKKHTNTTNKKKKKKIIKNTSSSSSSSSMKKRTKNHQSHRQHAHRTSSLAALFV